LGFEAEAYSRIRSDSIDYAVMEKSSEVAVVRATFDWNDIGAWDAVASRFSPDAQGNRSDAETVWVDCQNSFVSSKGRLVALVGCQDLSVIDSDDALLVLKNGNEQKVKKVVEQLQAAGDSRAHFHTTVYRPWGSYTTLAEFPACKVKMIRVNPGAILSLQSHEYRSEHWIVVSGKARVVNGEQEFDLDVNASTWIPQGAKHRLANREQTPLEVIEVQWGSYFGEEDIVRYDDLYGRIEKTGSF
jgi:mannose-1-phosphate guanylyltransferase